MKRSVLLAAVLFLAAGVVFGEESPVWKAPTIRENTVWRGTVLLEQGVVVERGAVLRILPGTVVRAKAGKGVAITVLGRLQVEGTKELPVTFSSDGEIPPGEAAWEGIRLADEGEQSHSLEGFRVERAREGVSLTGASATFSGGTFSECGSGIRGNQKSQATVADCAFEGNAAGAVLSLGARGTFSGCRFETIGNYGIVADKGALFAVSGSTFSRGKIGIYTLTNAPCRIEGSAFLSLETGIAARQVGKDSLVSRCRFEHDGTAVAAVQFCDIEIADSTFRENKTGIDVREFSAPFLHHNRFEGHETAVNLFRKAHARVEKNVFFHNRNAVMVNYSSYPKIAGNNFDRNDMSVRLGKFQSGDWEEREGSPKLTAGEASLRGAGNRPAGIGQVLSGGQAVVYPKRVNAVGNWWGPDADRDRGKGTLGKIWDGKKFGPVTYEGFGEKKYEIDVVDFSGESTQPFPDAGPREPGSPS
ncbi:MAG: hypothetical protein Kow00128_16430 [Deltaproteobacteria bacterium]